MFEGDLTCYNRLVLNLFLMFKKLSTLFLAGVILFGLTGCDPFDIVKSWGVALTEFASGPETDGDEMDFDEDDSGEDWTGDLTDFDEAMGALTAAQEESEEEEWEPSVFESGTYGLIGTMYIDSTGDPAFDSYMKCLNGVNGKYVHHYDYCDATWGPFDEDIENMRFGEMLECMNSDPAFREDADNCWLNYMGEWGVGVGGY